MMKKIWIIICVLSLSFFNGSSSNGKNVEKKTEEKEIPAKKIQLSDQSGDKIPILAWGGIDRHSSVRMYKDMAEAGFTINLGLDLTATPTKENIHSLFAALDRANEADIKQMVGASWLDFLSGEDLTRLTSHPALAGYYFMDEPVTYEWLDSLDRWVDRVRKIDDKHFGYINLAGADCRGSNWAPELIGCTGEEPSPYTRFVKRYAEIDIPMISVDRYPVVVDTVTQQRKLFPGWYYTLERTSSEARRTGKDLWAFALSTQLFLPNGIIYPIPTVDDLRLQMYSNLAYGAQVLQYYTYVPSGNSAVWGQPPLTSEGLKTSTWYLLQEMNREFQALAPVFLRAKVNWIAHTGEIPDGCVELDKSKLPSIFKSLEITEGNGALVSYIEKGEDNFLVVVNHDIVGDIKVKATGNGNLYRLNREAAPVELGNNPRLLTPGDICVFFWKD
jgi:hypothetical protein